MLERLGTSIEWLPAEDLGLDSIYVRDASIVSDAGAIPCSMGKPARSRPLAPGSCTARVAALGSARAGCFYMSK